MQYSLRPQQNIDTPSKKLSINKKTKHTTQSPSYSDSWLVHQNIDYSCIFAYFILYLRDKNKIYVYFIYKNTLNFLFILLIFLLKFDRFIIKYHRNLNSYKLREVLKFFIGCGGTKVFLFYLH